MNYLDVQKHLFQFYGDALQKYVMHFENPSELIGADALMDILFSYSIRYSRLFNESILKTAHEMFESNYQPFIKIQDIDVKDKLQKYEMGVLYRIHLERQYVWVGSTGQLCQSKLTSIDEAKEAFRRELRYQWLNIQQIVGLFNLHQNLMVQKDLPIEHKLTNLVLYYLDYQVLEDIWDTSKLKGINLHLIHQFAAELLKKLLISNRSSNLQVVIDLLKLKFDVDIREFGIENFYKLCVFFQNLHIPQSEIPIFPRFLIYHETHLMYALHQTHPDFEIDDEYPGEMMQFFMLLYPYLSFDKQWTCENAENLMTQGRLFSAVLKKHLGLNVDETFSFSQLKNLRTDKRTYLDILQELPPELRRAFYENTANTFDSFLNDRRFIESVFRIRDNQLLLSIENQSGHWGRESVAWMMSLPFDKFQDIFGDDAQMVLNTLLRKQGYNRQEPQALDERYMVLTSILQLNEYLKTMQDKKYFMKDSAAMYRAGFWLKMIFFYPQEYTSADLIQHQKYLKSRVLDKIYQSSVFQKIIHQPLMMPADDKNEPHVIDRNLPG